MAGASNLAQIRRVPTAVIVIRGTPSLDSATAKVTISLEIHRKVLFPMFDGTSYDHIPFSTGSTSRQMIEISTNETETSAIGGLINGRGANKW